MRLPVRIGSARRTKAERQAAPGSRRDRLAVLLAFVTVVGLGLAFVLSKSTQFLMPGPLASGHAAIENCSACHTKSGTGKLSWIHGLVAGDRLADSKSCLTCHKMPDTAFNAHGTSTEVLKESTKRLTKVAAETPAPQSARAQSIAFPADDVLARGLSCATCHQEHQGANFKLNKITNEQCQSCHAVKFDSFDGYHPKFENYPFEQRTRIIYDHAGHFGKHYPEVAKKDPAKPIPATCSSCHNSSKDKRVMTVAPFEQTCTACHLDQIIGKERVSGPKGIAFLALPGLDLQTLKKKKASIGEWPDASEAGLTPFMKVMINRNERGRALLKTVESLNLQDLGGAGDDQIKAVTNLVWEIKGLFYALIKGKASDVLAELDIGGNGKLSATLISDLIASIPRDVVISAHQQWLPNLGREMANRPATSDQERSGWITTTTKSNLAFGNEAASDAKRDPPAQANQQTESTLGSVAAKPEGAARKSNPGNEAPSTGEQPRTKAADQTDDLLFPTEDELRAIKRGVKEVKKAAQPERAAGKTDAADPKHDSAAFAVAASKTDANAFEPQTRAAVVSSIQSDVDPESWAAYGGWYRQDYAIFYRPVGHKDKFIYSWLVLTGPQAPKGDASPAAAVFNFLTSKDAQGSCTKCHSVDESQGKGRVVNFSPPSVESKQGRFTNFIHEPHFGMLKNRGCLTCHDLEKGAAYLKSYEQGNPQSFVSNFGAVKKDLCQTCHSRNKARQDCLLCHKYHVNGVNAPIINTENVAP
jgi:Doubled CXXCH motif (Paired_CXXCH_1)